MRFTGTLAAIAIAATCLTAPALASDDDDDAAASPSAQAGLMARGNREDLPKIEIEADGSQELARAGAGFFRAIWIDEIVIEGIEIRPLGVDSMEFDDAGTAEISFIAIRPGTYTLGVPGSEFQRVEIVIE